MFCCSVCHKIEDFSIPGLRRHIQAHVKASFRFKYPLQCFQPNCPGLYADLDSFIVHIKKNHRDVRVTDNFEGENLVNNEDLPLDNHLCHPNENLNNDAKFDNIEALRPLERECYKEKVVSLLLKFFSNSSIPQSFTEEILKGFVDFINTLRSNLLLIVESLNIPHEDSASIFDEVYRALNAVRNVDSVYKATETVYKHPLFVEPQSVILGYRNEANLRNGNVKNVERKEESYYIPVIQTLKVVLSDPEMANLILDEEDDAVLLGTYTNPKHGSKYRNHPLFSDKTKKSVRIQLSYDGMGTTNPLRGYSSIHNVGIFYFTIQNLPVHFNTCFPNAHLLAVCYTGDLKKYGFRPIIEKFMKDIKILETTAVKIDVPGRGEVTIFGSISQFCGDCLAINEIFGLVCDFSHDYHCSMWGQSTPTHKFVPPSSHRCFSNLVCG